MKKVPAERVQVEGLHSPRRRAVMLGLITLAALVPIGVGVAVSQLERGGTTHTTPTVMAPDAMLGSHKLPSGIISWGPPTSRISDPNPPGAPSAFPILGVSPNQALAIDFSNEYPLVAAPFSVTLALDEPGARSTSVLAGNPVHVNLDEPAGTYTFVLHTKWSLGSVDYYLRVKVS